MRDLGVLNQLEQAKDKGVTAKHIADNLDISFYGIETLLESGLSCGVVETVDDTDSFVLSKVGYFLLHDPMTRINMDYNHYICYLGMYNLDEAIKTEKPAGLRVFGEQWETIYQALPHLPDTIKQSWYAFDHFYSDSAYPDVLPLLFKNHPKTMLDIGANIGKFSIIAAQYDPNIEITMMDLPDQLQNAIKNVSSEGLDQRIKSLAVDLLDQQVRFNKEVDIYWLSQLLSCFGKDEITGILKRIVDAMGRNSTVYILETCWDRQQHESAAFSLINTSLYFTAIASGNSKMYHSKDLVECCEAAGLQLTNIFDNLGICHTLFECKKRD